ncbi:zinc finger protein [Cinnamomum micranthum f. kanehirae]|uniref:S-acyltransferase n=1 Tax=Cinnamomum micranthum f. kanehirae TaxID=337451 RepID=A0A3S3MB24_9MAGN|nr:zinc finger protein [Cinnamomum micranthum f. kanehirae]
MQEKRKAASGTSELSESNRRIIDSSGQAKRVYQVWKGSNRFFLGGRLIFGPDARSLAFTVSLIVIPVILFAVFVSPRLVNEFQYYLGNAIVAIAVILTVYDICLLFLTSGRDPGIIPRSTHPPEPECGDVPTSGANWAGNQGTISSIPPTKEILVNGVIVKVKYCHTCMLYRPPRCSHCSICDNCVDRFDHHCPWVGQCIGKRNYRFFFMFVSCTTLLCLYIFAFCWVNIKTIMDEYDCSPWMAFMESPVSAILILYTFIVAWFVGGLTVFHLYLIFSNQTTYENFRYRYEGKLNPYNRGCTRNVMEIFFTRIPKSKNNFRARVTEDSSTFNPPVSVTKTSFDIETGGKRQAVSAEEFEDIQNQFGLERCRPQPEHSLWGEKENWEFTPDILALAAEYEMELGFKDRDKTHGSHLNGP